MFSISKVLCHHNGGQTFALRGRVCGVSNLLWLPFHIKEYKWVPGVCLTKWMCELLCSSSPSTEVPMLLTCFMLEFSATPVTNHAPWFIGLEQTSNRAFPSYLVPLFQSETFHEFNLHVNKHVGKYISILMVLHTDF